MSYTTHSGLNPPSAVSNRTNNYKILQNYIAMLTGQPDGGYSSVEIYFSPGVSRFIANWQNQTVTLKYHTQSNGEHYRITQRMAQSSECQTHIPESFSRIQPFILDNILKKKCLTGKSQWLNLPSHLELEQKVLNLKVLFLVASGRSQRTLPSLQLYIHICSLNSCRECHKLEAVWRSTLAPPNWWLCLSRVFSPCHPPGPAKSGFPGMQSTYLYVSPILCTGWPEKDLQDPPGKLFEFMGSGYMVKLSIAKNVWD